MATSFHELSFRERYATLGDPAEAVFEAVAPAGNFDRFGWHRPRNGFGKMTPLLRNQPDYYVQTGHLVEVMGCGKDGILKLKLHKMAALRQWHKLQPVKMFVWNSHLGRWALIDFPEVERLFNHAKKKGVEQFHDGPKYVEIPWANVEKLAEKVDSYDPAVN